MGVLVTTSFFGQLGIDALAEAPVHLPALAAVLFGAMAGVKLEPGRSRPRFFQRQPLSLLTHS